MADDEVIRVGDQLRVRGEVCEAVEIRLCEDGVKELTVEGDIRRHYERLMEDMAWVYATMNRPMGKPS